MHLDQWAVGAAIVADHPLLGTGQETYVLMFDAYRDDVLAPDRAALLSHFRPESPHNVYLATAAGAGVPALLAYLAVIGAAVACAIRAAASAAADTNTRIFVAAGLAAIAGHLVTDMFLTAETSGSVVFWVALGAAAAAGVRSEGEPSRPSATGSPRAAGSSIIRSVDAAPNAPEA
jgi:O-antigen ligase